MVLPKRRSIISNEERITRMKEARQKYSQMTKPKTSNRAEPRPSIAPSMMTRGPLRAAQRGPSAVSKTSVENHDDDEFKIDPNSLAMIKSGKITIPVSRPSISAPRHTFGARQSLIGRPISRFRASMAAQEPRPSLLPLGINVFEANASQRNEVSEFLNSIITTPAKPNTSTSSSNILFSGTLNSVRQRKIRFVEAAIQEARESAESAEVDAAAASSSSSIRHSPTNDTLFMPTSILSTKKDRNRKKVNLSEPPVAATPRISEPPATATPRKINFDEEDSTEEPEKENDTNNIEEKIVEFEKLVDFISITKLSDETSLRIKNAISKLQKTVVKSPLKRVVPNDSMQLSSLGSLLGSVQIEGQKESSGEEENSFLNAKKKRRTSQMKVGQNVRRSLLRRSSRIHNKD